MLCQDIQATRDSIHHDQAMLVKQLDNIMRTFNRKFNQLEATNKEFKSLITQHVNTLYDQFQIVKDHLEQLENAQNNLELAQEQHRTKMTSSQPSNRLMSELEYKMDSSRQTQPPVPLSPVNMLVGIQSDRLLDEEKVRHVLADTPMGR